MKSCGDRKGSADRGGDKKTNMAVDWQNTEETRQTSGQDKLFNGSHRGVPDTLSDDRKYVCCSQAKTHFEAHKDVRT